MVAVRRTRGSRQALMTFCLLVLVVAGLKFLAHFLPSNESLLTWDFEMMQDVLSLEPDARAMRLWRIHLGNNCKTFLDSLPSRNISSSDLETKAQLEDHALRSIARPDSSSLIPDRRRPTYQPCKHVFLDLGTNRGDSIACGVDASLDACSAHFLNKDPGILRAYRVSKEFPRLHLDVDNLEIYGKGNQGLSLLRLLQDFYSGPGMESVCVYGMEGNPFFTEKLQKLEEYVNQMQPRPLKHLHIHTDTIITDHDGPAVLNIDQHSEKNHYWGSSVLQSMPDVRKTTRQNNGTTIQAEVQGITLSTLLKRTLVALDTSDEEMQSGGSLLVKMDVEGAEFSVLKELAASGTLCEYLKLGNQATFVVEFHQHLTKSEEEKAQSLAGLKDARETLRNCGAKFRQLPNFWT